MKSRKISTTVSFKLNAKKGSLENIQRKFLPEYFEKSEKERNNFL